MIRGANMIGSTDSELGVYTFYKKSRRYLKVLGVMRVIRSMFQTQDANVQNLVTTVT